MRLMMKRMLRPLAAILCFGASQAAAGTITLSTQDLADGETVGEPVEFTSIPIVTIDGGFSGLEPLSQRSFLAEWFLSKELVEGLEVDLSAEALFEILRFDADGLEFAITITNTVSLAELDGRIANVLSFGFGVEPDVDAEITESGSVFGDSSPGSGGQESFPGGFKKIDVCIFGANNCAGGSVNAGLAAESSDSLKLLLTPETGMFVDPETGSSPYAQLAAFPIKFQGDFGSFEFVSFPDDGGRIPVPPAIALLGAGLILVGWARRRA